MSESEIPDENPLHDFADRMERSMEGLEQADELAALTGHFYVRLNRTVIKRDPETALVLGNLAQMYLQWLLNHRRPIHPR